MYGQQPPTVTQQPIGPHNNYVDDPPPAYTFTSTAGQVPGASPNFHMPPPMSQPVYSSHYPGLEVLTRQHHLFIKQEVTDTFFNSQNHYKVVGVDGQPMYAIVEKTGALMRFFGGSNQSFSLIMKDMAGQDILFMEGSPGFWGGGARINVTYQGMQIGAVQQGGDICNPHYIYNIHDQTGNVVLTAQSRNSYCCFGIGGTAEFPILQPDGQQIGQIGKEYGGFGREFFSNAQTFSVNFPLDLHVAIKAVLLAATVMIDFQLFERR